MNEEKFRISSGRTENRGNMIEISYNGVSVKISDDRKKPIPQIKLKEMCIDFIEQIADSEPEPRAGANMS